MSGLTLAFNRPAASTAPPGKKPLPGGRGRRRGKGPSTSWPVGWLPSRGRQRLPGDRRDERCQEDATCADDNCERARQQRLWREVSVADRQSCYEGEVNR